MIGKSKWFNLRKYGGWGINPRTWQGYLYILCVAAIIAIPQFLSWLSFETKLAISGSFALLFLIDVLDIMSKFKLDEREEAHQAKAEKNASLAMVFGLGITLLYTAFSSITTSKINYELLIVVFTVLFMGYLAKVITYYKLEK